MLLSAGNDSFGYDCGQALGYFIVLFGKVIGYLLSLNVEDPHLNAFHNLLTDFLLSFPVLLDLFLYLLYLLVFILGNPLKLLLDIH